MSLFKNASPDYISLGTNDKSSVPLLPSRDPIPQHVPLVYIYAEKGTSDKILVSGSKATAFYGSGTFDKEQPYYKHTTKLLEQMYGAGNVCMVKRMIPADAGARSNTTLYVDVLQTTVPNYVRNSLGAKVIDPATNAYKVDATTPTIPGVEIKFITEHDTVATGQALGTKVSKTGTMVDASGNPSTMYPIVELLAKYQGKYYNNIGIAIESLIGSNADVTTMVDNKAYEYALSLYTRNSATGTPILLRTLAGESKATCTLKNGSKNPLTNVKNDINYIFSNSWYNETNQLMPLRYNDYEGMHVYSSSLDTVLGMVMANEKTHISTVPATWDDGLTAPTSGWFDFTTDDQTALDAETYLINMFNGKSSKGVDYFTMVMNTSTPTLLGNQKEVTVSKDTPLFLDGGSDGTMSNADFEANVVIELAKYIDAESEVMDTAINVESVIYDSGYTLNTKKELFNFISLRKNTVLAVGTFDDSIKDVVPLSDERAIAVALKTRAKLAPESDYFGTPVARAIIVGGSEILNTDTPDVRSSQVFEIAVKTARLAGAGNFKWKMSELFDHGAKANLEIGYAPQPSFIPAGIKPTLWSDGMIWSQPKDRNTYFFPAIQTVYDDDTSVLNSWLTVLAVSTLNTIAGDAWREFTGSATLSDSAFKEAVLAYVNTRIEGIFGTVMTVIPEVIITAADAARGYSWQLAFKLYAPNMKTKMVTYTEVYRITP